MYRPLPIALWVVMTSAHADEALVLDKDFRTMMKWFSRGLRQSGAGLL